MRKTVKLLSVFFIFSCILIFVSCSKASSLNNNVKKNIALIVKMNYGYHWGTVKMGAEAAAREFNVNIDYAAPDDEDDVEGQIELVKQALEKKTEKIDALILAASDYKALVDVTEKAYNQGIPVIIIDSEVDTDKVNSYIATNNYDAGRKAGNVLVSIAGKNARIAIMSFVRGSRNAEVREDGIIDAISKYPDIKVVAREYCLSDTKRAYELTKKIIDEQGQIDAIVALNSISSEGVAQAINDMNLSGKVKIIAFDSSSQEIDYLEKGIIDATIIQNPFSMGYLGVKYAVDAIEGKSIPKQVDIASKVIDKNNMYLPENQKLLFPIIK